MYLSIFISVGIAERAISSMSGFQPQIEILEKRISNDANNNNIQINKNEERYQSLQERMITMNDTIKELNFKLEKTNTFASKLSLEVNENDRKFNNMTTIMEQRLHNETVVDREEMTKKLLSIQIRITSESERLQNDISKTEMNNATNNRHQLEDILDRIDSNKKNLLDELDRKSARVLESNLEVVFICL
jgi:chromosome segregation ATPase